MGAQNATPVEETLCNRLKSVAKTIPVKGTAPGRPGRPVEETLRKRSNATPAEETTSRCSEDDSCRRNPTRVVRMQALSHNLHLSIQNAKYSRSRFESGILELVSIALHAKYCRSRIGNEQGFATIDLHKKNWTNRIGRESRVGNQCFTDKILQKSHWERT